MQKTTPLKACDIMPISAKLPNYRYVDETATLAKIQIRKLYHNYWRPVKSEFWKYFDHHGGELQTKRLVPMHGL